VDLEADFNSSFDTEFTTRTLAGCIQPLTVD